jgi:hypothetical protein
VNGDFSGSDGWLVAGVPIGTPARIVTGSYYHSASRYAVLGEYDSSDEGLWQDFLVPANATTVSLSYWLYVNSLENNNQEYDKFDVTIRTVPNGNLIAQLDHESNLDHSNTSPSDPVAHYALKTFDLSSYLSSYKGQYMRLHFHCSTDPAIFTSFKVDDVSVQATVPIAPTPVLFSVSGYTSVAEGNTAQYNATVYYSDGSVASVTPSWSVSGPATISSSGLLTAGNVNSDTPATVTANYSGFGDLNFNLTIINVAPVFSSLALSGPSSINENSSG